MAFEIPLTDVINSTVNKQEVALEFAPPPPQADLNLPRNERCDHLVEMRFYIPGNVTAGMIKEDAGTTTFRDKSAMNANENITDGDEEGEITAALQKEVPGPDGEPLTSAAVFCDTVKNRTEQGKGSEEIVDFEEMLCLTPRGRFQISMYSTFLRLRGKTHDYKILFTSIKYLFLLPKPDDIHWLFVIALNPPLRQGQTQYPHLVFQFEKESEIEATLNLSEFFSFINFTGK